MKCPLCLKKSSKNHLRFCDKNENHLPIDELYKVYIEYNYPEVFGYDNLYRIYVSEKKSLPDIYKEFNVPYSTVLFMLKMYNIPKRNRSEASINAMKKREETNFNKYGAKNVLSKGTKSYDKKNQTIKDKYGVDNIFQIDEIKERIKNDEYYIKKYGMTLSDFKSSTHKRFWGSLSDVDRKLFIDMCNKKRRDSSLDKFGVDHPSMSNDIKDKKKTYYQDNFGCDFLFQTKYFIENTEIKNKVKETKIKNGKIISDEQMEPFMLYKRNCRKITQRVKKELFDKWDGHDYYDGEYIKENKNLNNTNPLYPTIDHKISIFSGFINNISEEEICDIKNLCITKRSINCKKREKNYETVS
jgi:hypothetical protein